VGRLRFWEVLAAAGSVVLVVALLALHWYAGPPRSGWAAIPTLRWFALVTAAFGLTLSITQVTSRGPALPVTLDLLATPVAGLTTILLAVRLSTTGATLAAGAYVGVVAAAATTLGAYRALRTEQGWTPGPERPVELVELASGPR
jgi:hypothetical protein